jgi:hypothetical protein
MHCSHLSSTVLFFDIVLYLEKEEQDDDDIVLDAEVFREQ